jgi:hypothetical protein
VSVVSVGCANPPAFYEKCGFKHKEYEMALYVNEKTEAPASRL